MFLETDACFQFYYHMNGIDMGDLVVIIQDKSRVETFKWSKSGHMNSSWTQARVSLPAETQKVSFYVKFIYKVAEGSRYRSNITLCRN